MLIIIDGYNVIRQSEALRRFERKSLEAGRDALIGKLAAYQNKKGHDITVVFDGGQSDWIDEGRDKAGRINIFYSRFGERADDIIKRIAAQAAGDVIVVSSDREITSYVERLGKTPLASPDFETLMNRTIASAPRRTAAARDQEDTRGGKTTKKGPARRLPRAARRTQKKFEKL